MSNPIENADAALARYNTVDAWGYNECNQQRHQLAKALQALAEHVAAEAGDVVTIPRPHVPYGPHGVPGMLADADYLDHSARNLADGYKVGGYNVTSTVIKLLHDTATALRALNAKENTK